LLCHILKWLLMRAHLLSYTTLLCFFIVIAGCSTAPTTQNSNTLTPAVTPTQGILDVATPYGTPTVIQTRNTVVTPTLNPDDMVCMIDRSEQVFTTYNKKAVAFNLANAPMYINYTIPDTKKGSDGNYASYYAITVRDKSTGTIISQGTFGKNEMEGGYFDLQFGGYDVIRIMKSGNFLIETEGKDITVISEIWVKPKGNLDSSIDTKNLKCIIWPQSYKEGRMHTPWGQSEMGLKVDKTEE